MNHSIIQRVEKLALPILKEEGLDLVDIEYKKEGQNWFLRVFIDREESAINIDDCTRVSEQLSKALDKEDPIPQSYILEVSSPGAERPLKKEADFQKSIGKRIHVTTYEPIDGNKVFEGVLIHFTPDRITVEEKEGTREIPFKKIAKARLAISF